MAFRFMLVLLVLAGCKSAEQKQAEAALRQLTEAGKQLGSAVGAAAGTAVGTIAGGAPGMVRASEPVDFRDLKSALPENLPGMNRTSAEGEKAGAMGFVMSYAEGRYEAEDGGRIGIKITDLGAATGVAALAAFGWMMAEVDRETETGYEKTTTIKGNKGYEKYDRQSKNGEVSLLVANRFIVEMSGSNTTMEAIKDALDKVDLGKLEQMRNVGVK